jgi:hypothetical protein
MMKLMKVFRPLLAIAALCVTLDANADYLWTWHYVYPQFQKFQASFEVTDEEMQPGATFSSDLFHNTIEVDSLSGVQYRGNDPTWSDSSGAFSPNFELFMNLHDSSHTITLGVAATGPNFEGNIYEFFPGGTTIQEHGWWTFQQIPEPSVLAVLAVAGAVWAVKRRR